MKIESFINYLTYERRYSKHTIKSYRIDLIQFHSYLNRQYELTEIESATHIHIRSWIVKMVQEGISNRSVNRKISTLKSFFKYQKRKGLITSNPMQKIVSPKQSKRLPSFVQEKHIDRLLDDVIQVNDFPGIRDLLMLELLYQTGVRRSELINLKESDFNRANSTLKVFGKGQKERLIPISNQLLVLLDKYLSFRSEEFPDIEFSLLVITDRGKPMYPKFVYNKVKQYLSLVTTLTQRSPHVLRHSFATHLSNGGAELNAIKSLLGHSSLAATQVYMHNTIEKLKKAHKTAHPKG
jgi:integrase/recombinase XerC